MGMGCEKMKSVIEQVSFLDGAIFLNEVNEGWSDDKKFIYEQSGEKYLVRVRETSLDLFNYKVSILKKFSSLSDRLPKLIDASYIDEHQVLIFEWLEGQSILEVIDGINEEKQFALGQQAGKILRDIHKESAPGDTIEWSKRYNEKIDRVILSYQQGKHHFNGDSLLIDYIENNRYLLNGIKNNLQHGDFHMGNMIVKEDELFVIDLDRCDYGCSVEEYNRFYFTSKFSPAFANGQLQGYQHPDKEKFFKLMKLYLATNMISTFVWTVRFGQNELNTSYENARYLLEQYDNFERLYPKWYQDN